MSGSKVFLATLIILGLGMKTSLAQSDSYVIKTYTTDDGLPHNHIRGLAQDKEGFLWIATWDGLSRYDGYEFKTYYHDPADSTSLPYFDLLDVVVDSSNEVWVVSRYLSRYNRATDNFTNYYYSCLSKDFNDPTLTFSMDEKGNWWYLCADTTMNCISYAQKNMHEYRLYPPVNKQIRRMIIQDGKAYMISDQLLRIYSLDEQQRTMSMENEFVSVDMTNISIPQLSDPILKYFIVETADNDFLLNTNFGLFKPDYRSYTTKKIERSDLDQISQYLDNINWLMMQDGLMFIPRHQDPMFIPRNISGFAEGLLLDKSNTLWFGGLSVNEQSTGLNAAFPVRPFFKHWLANDPSGEKLAVFATFKDHCDDLWLGAKKMDHMVRLRQNGDVDNCNNISEEEMILSRQPRSMVEVGDSVLWIGYYNKLFRKYDYRTNRFTDVDLTFAPGIQKKPINCMLILKYDERHLLISTRNRLALMDMTTCMIRELSDDVDGAIYSMYIDNDGTIWTGYRVGYLGHFTAGLELISEYKISISNLESICPGDTGILWVTSLGQGLVKFDTKTSKSRIFTTRDGLSNNTLYNVLKDNSGKLWITSNHGISMFNPATEQFRNFDISDGLLIDEFDADAAYFAPDGEIIFGGVGGIVRFYPDSLTENLVAPSARLLITELRVSGNQRFFEKAVYQTSQVMLSKGDNNFKLLFACTDLKNADNIRYRYKLGRIDKDWIMTGQNNRSVSYSGLKPGNWHFDVEATNPSGDWQYKTSLDIRIPPFYYQTVWFRAGLILLISAILATIILQRLHHERMKNRHLQQNLRLEALRGQLNPHFIYNSLNSINYFISKADRENANQYIADFARLMRAILDNSTADYILLSKEIESVTDYLELEHMRFGDKFDYEIIVAQELETENIEVAPTMLQPFIENAIWHGVRYLENRKGFIIVRFESLHKQYLRCAIEDDGIGRQQSAIRKSPGQMKKRSRGIKIIMERMAILNALDRSDRTITIDDLYPGREECGTRVVIDLPARERV